jgi:hypothetical protein
MEKTQIISVESKNEVWELPDDLVIKLEAYKEENPLAPDNSNADEIHQAWFSALTPAEQQKIIRRNPDEPKA